MLTLGAGQPVTIEIDRVIKLGELLGNYDLAAYLEQACTQEDDSDS
jgi:hypothetical protein